MTATTSSAQNFFGQFVDTFEEVVVPDAAVGDDDHAWTTSTMGLHRNRGKTVFDRFFRAMEKVNLPLADSTDSLASALSTSSFRSSQDDLSGGNLSGHGSNVFTAEMFLEAVETLTLKNQFGSTNSLASQDFRAPAAAPAPSAAVAAASPETAIQVFFRALEQFLVAKEEGDEDEFPKFC